MPLSKEKAQIMAKLVRGKGNWGSKYDRLEHFKRFPNLKKCIKELSKEKLVLIHKKPNYTGISLNTNKKSEIIAFVEKHLIYMKDLIK